MPPKKKQAFNAFYFYMLERKGHFERIGERFPNGMKDLADICGPEWRMLSLSARKKYEDIAREQKARSQEDTSRKYTNQHNSFEYTERRKAEEKEARETMNKEIESKLRTALKTNTISEIKFYLIHVNYFCISAEGCYYPAELAVAEFNLAEGVTNLYHTIINTGPVPCGYRYDAVHQSESVHHIPLEPNDGEKQFYFIWDRIKKILEHGRVSNGGAYPPMYTMPDNVNLNTSISCIKSVVRTLCETTDENREDFPIYALDKLFFELKNNCVLNYCSSNNRYTGKLNGERDFFSSVSFANTQLEKDIYSLSSDIACSFHYNEDQVENCSKSFVQRWAFLICRECCPDLNIQLVPGKHVPKDSHVDLKRQYDLREKKREPSVAETPIEKGFHFVDSVDKRNLSFTPIRLPKPAPSPTDYNIVASLEETNTLVNTRELE